MTPEEMGKLAVKLFDNGYHCSQAIFSAAMRKLDRQEVDAVIRCLSPFGGGIASTGNTCGTILGALAVVGFMEGKSAPEGRDGKAMWKISYNLFKSFEELTRPYGGPNCSNIARVNWKDMNDVRSFRKDPSSRRKECLHIIEQTAIILAKILEDIERKKEEDKR